jgi:hypothetical protein
MSTQEDLGARASGGAGAQGGMGAQGGAAAQPSEEELRAAYEAELSRISSADMILQSAASLLNIGGLRLGLVREAGGSSSPVERDLEQVRDAIDAVRALLPILERHSPQQLRPLRDALSQLQMAYTRELQNEASPPAPEEPIGQPSTGRSPAAASPKKPDEPSGRDNPGPAESSGRLWVPGR